MKKDFSWMLYVMIFLSISTSLVNDKLPNSLQWIAMLIAIADFIVMIIFIIKVKAFKNTKCFWLLITGFILGIGAFILQENVSQFPQFLAVSFETVGTILIITYLIINVINKKQRFSENKK